LALSLGLLLLLLSAAVPLACSAGVGEGGGGAPAQARKLGDELGRNLLGLFWGPAGNAVGPPTQQLAYCEVVRDHTARAHAAHAATAVLSDRLRFCIC
jgi:hypothetical protein